MKRNLRKGVLDELRLPLNVISGHLKKLEIILPGWTKLTSMPTVVKATGVFILCRPLHQGGYDVESAKRQIWNIKKSKLQPSKFNHDPFVFWR